MVPYPRIGKLSIVAIRWMLLIIVLLTYMKQEAHYESLVMPIVIVHAFYHVMVVRRGSAIGAEKAILAIDLLFSLYAVSVSGGLDSPFLVCGFVSVLLIGGYVRWKLHAGLAVLYCGLVPVILALTGGGRMLRISDLQSIYFLCIVLLFAILMGLRFSHRHMRANIRSWIRIASMSHRSIRGARRSTVGEYEGLLRKLLDRSGVTICVDVPARHHARHDWNRMYYYDLLKRSAPSRKKGRMHLMTPTGISQLFDVRALHTREGGRYGWLLVEVGTSPLTLMHRLFIRLALSRFDDSYHEERVGKAAQDRAIADERHAIAQNIHDGLAQEMFFISIQLFQLRSKLPPEARELVSVQLADLEKRIKDTHGGIRNYINELKNEKKRFQLYDAIEKMLARITANTGVEPHFENIGWVASEQLEVEETIYRLIEEAANNVVKHAQATRLTVRLEVTSLQWSITIADNGIGMNVEASRSSSKHGLAGMEKRIRAMHGALAIRSAVSKGTKLEAYIPRERS